MTTEGTLLRQRYEIQGLLGEGGFGKTYEGLDRATNSPVAIKTISFAQMQDWKALDFFQREVEALSKLDHPGIPKYIDSFYEDTETDRVFYLVRELAVGESLEKLIKRGWRATEAEIRHIIRELLKIMIYLHELNPPVIHRDIKPSNIIYQPDSRKVFLIDFGSVFQATASGIGTFVGTYGYIAPEQMRGEVSPQSDIYSVAMTLAFLLTGREPSELPRKELKLDLRSSRVNASPQLLEWLDRANEPIPEDRFASARVALYDLRSRLSKLLPSDLAVPAGSSIKVKHENNRLEISLPYLFIPTKNLINLVLYFTLVFPLYLTVCGLVYLILLFILLFITLLFIVDGLYSLINIFWTILTDAKNLWAELRALVQAIPKPIKLVLQDRLKTIRANAQRGFRTIIIDNGYLEIKSNSKSTIVRGKLKTFSLSKETAEHPLDYYSVSISSQNGEVLSISRKLDRDGSVHFQSLRGTIFLSPPELHFIYSTLSRFLVTKHIVVDKLWTQF
ncbi:MAG: serine/threonine-protein kinase [Pseudanabaenaceae cyanobacterium SKYGB_i_bin29]|nr:serine/threonine protein kinase [Pseudanabaenaceae cyanobacterium SKYG29]MDW8422336.1 serine/threonine-protein kinase [Pseudanabaenaceae cyanobacterium SKYGB_i_bin29]